MRVLVDMNLPPRWTAEFKSQGIEASHWSAVGSLAASDREILAWCAEQGYVLFTHDLDFGAILDALRGAEPALAEGALVTIEPTRHRIRLLPLRPE
jgi:predicted nuclease of predicted toxin-antitoxin system